MVRFVSSAAVTAGAVGLSLAAGAAALGQAPPAAPPDQMVVVASGHAPISAAEGRANV